VYTYTYALVAWVFLGFFVGSHLGSFSVARVLIVAPGQVDGQYLSSRVLWDIVVQ
jgi:hypothetical protein